MIEESVLADFYAQHLSQREIARKLGVSATKVRYWSRRYSLVPSQPVSSISESAYRDAFEKSGSIREMELLLGTSNRESIRIRAEELGLDLTALGSVRNTEKARKRSVEARGAAAEHLAIAWYLMHGFQVSVPSSPSRYDLLAEDNGVFTRVQVKSSDSEVVSLCSRSERGSRRGYTKSELDEFFVLNPSGMYRIPLRFISGSQTVTLPGRYREFRVEIGLGLGETID